MSKRNLLLTVMLLFILIFPIAGQQMENDPEAEEIHARIVNLFYEFDVHTSYTNEDITISTIEFKVMIELWNPYNTNLTTYGSSSCRWPTLGVIELNNLSRTLNTTKVCTSDYAPREYASGLSNVTETISLNIENASLDYLPAGQYLFNPSMNDYNNESDIYYGLNMTVFTNQSILYEFDNYPDNWGEITKSINWFDTLSFPILVLPIISLFFVIRLRNLKT